MEKRAEFKILATGLDLVAGPIRTSVRGDVMKSRDKFNTTVPLVDLKKFMAKWYVIAGRTTFLERNAFNSIERYVWNEKENKIEIEFCCRKGAFDGKVKRIPQTGWVANTKTNAHWKVQPFWPLKLDYLIIGLGEDYSWTAIGVPNQKYLWIMAKEPELPAIKLTEIIAGLDKIGYSTHDIKSVPQQKHFNDRNCEEQGFKSSGPSSVTKTHDRTPPESLIR